MAIAIKCDKAKRWEIHSPLPDLSVTSNLRLLDSWWPQTESDAGLEVPFFIKKAKEITLVKSHVLQVHEHPSQENIQNVKLAIQLASGNTLSFTR